MSSLTTENSQTRKENVRWNYAQCFLEEATGDSGLESRAGDKEGILDRETVKVCGQKRKHM